LGVSDEKVVATMDSPASHQGTDRPEAKNSVVLEPERFARKSAGTKHTRMETTTISQSIQEMVIGRGRRGAGSASGGNVAAGARRGNAGRVAVLPPSLIMERASRFRRAYAAVTQDARPVTVFLIRLCGYD
jgi:hypothetical protein